MGVAACSNLASRAQRVFDELGAVPVLLSLLILCLRAQGAGDEAARLPADIFELYSFAITGVLRIAMNPAFTSADIGRPLTIIEGDVHVGGERRAVQWSGSTPADVVGRIVDVESHVGLKVTIETGASFENPLSPDRRAPERETRCRDMLRRIAAKNNLVQRRVFELEDVKEALKDHGDELELFLELMRGGAIPLVKVLASDGERSGEFQFKHKSFQEALFVEAVIRCEVPEFWQNRGQCGDMTDDEVAALALNNTEHKNTFDIGRGYLGNALAQQRPVWNFVGGAVQLVADDENRGWARLQRLLLHATHLVRLTLPIGLRSEAEVLESVDGARSLCTMALPTSLHRDFRVGRVSGIVPEPMPLASDEAGGGDGADGGAAVSAGVVPPVVAAEVAAEGVPGPVAGAHATHVDDATNAPRAVSDGAYQSPGVRVRRHIGGHGSAEPEVEWAERVSEKWFEQDTPAVALEIGFEGARVRVGPHAALELDQAVEDTDLLLHALRALVPSVAAAEAADDDTCAALLASDATTGVSPLAALARHTGSADVVDALVRRHPDKLGGAALLATMRPGLLHNAWRLVCLQRRTSAGVAAGRCLGNALLEEVVTTLRATPAAAGGPNADANAWQSIALDDAQVTASMLLDELIGRVGAARDTVPDLLQASLLYGDRPSVALRLATKHFPPPNVIDVPPLLAVSGGGAADSRWRQMVQRKENAALVDHLIGRAPELSARITEECLAAVRMRRYELLRRVVSNGGLTSPNWDGQRFVEELLAPTEKLPPRLYLSGKRAKGRGNASGHASDTETLETLTAMLDKLGSAHRAALTAMHTPWTVLLLDEANHAMASELAATYEPLQRAMASPSALILAMVPPLAGAAHWLLTQAEQAATKRGEHGYAQFDDPALIQALLEPGAGGDTSWSRLQASDDEGARRLVNHIMVGIVRPPHDELRARLGSLVPFLCEKHAGRAADLVESRMQGGGGAAAPLDSGDVHALLAQEASADFLKRMSWEQAIMSPGAIVHDSPHNYPDNVRARRRRVRRRTVATFSRHASPRVRVRVACEGQAGPP